MSAFSSLNTIATEIRRGFNIDGDELSLFRFPMFRNELLLRYFHLIYHFSSVLNQFDFYLTLDIFPNIIHNLLTFFRKVSLLSKTFGDVLTDILVTMLKKAIWHQDRHCSYQT